VAIWGMCSARAARVPKTATGAAGAAAGDFSAEEAALGPRLRTASTRKSTSSTERRQLFL